MPNNLVAAAFDGDVKGAAAAFGAVGLGDADLVRLGLGVQPMVETEQVLGWLGWSGCERLDDDGPVVDENLVSTAP